MKMSTEVVIAVVVILMIVGGICGCISMLYLSEAEIIATVTDKERVTTGSGDSISSKYLIFTGTETFENVDSLLFGKYNSSDIYGQIERGKTYRFRVNWYRVPWMSMYRNIISMEEL